MSIEYKNVPIAEIYCDDEFNCRGGKITPYDVRELSADIQENGLLQPIKIHPYDKIPGKKYRIVLGHRRYTAILTLKWDFIPCLIDNDLDELNALVQNFSENLKRKDLNPIQEANHLMKFRKRGLTLEEIAGIFKYSSTWVLDRLNLLQFPSDVQDEIASGMVSTSQAKIILDRRLPTDQMYEQVRHIKEAKVRGEKLTLRSSEKTEAAIKGDPYKAKIRPLCDIRSMQDIIHRALGPCLATRVLAWAGGNVSNLHILIDIKNEAEAQGIFWQIPADILKRAETINDIL